MGGGGCGGEEVLAWKEGVAGRRKLARRQSAVEFIGNTCGGEGPGAEVSRDLEEMG